MNRRNTVSVTPAIGAKTVAGETVTDPIRNDAGTTARVGRACVGRTLLSDNSVPGAGADELSQNFFTGLFYFASEFTLNPAVDLTAH